MDQVTTRIQISVDSVTGNLDRPSKNQGTSTRKRKALRQHQRNAKHIPTTQDSEKIYIVERVLKYKTVRGRRMAWIKWKGYPESDSTWEPVDAIFDLNKAWKETADCSIQVTFLSENFEVDTGRTCGGDYGVYLENSDERIHCQTNLTLAIPDFPDDKTALWDPASSLTRQHDAHRDSTYSDIILLPTNEYNKPASSWSGSVDQTVPDQRPCASEIFNGSPTRPTLMEQAVKLELKELVPRFKAIDQWSAEEVRDHLKASGCEDEADKLYQEDIDKGGFDLYQ